MLRRGDGELTVVELEDAKYDRATGRYAAELFVLRVGSRQWEIKPPVPVVRHERHGDGGGDDDGDDRLFSKFWSCFERGAAITVGDRYLCYPTTTAASS
ncbi:hypothetical protein ACP4OV_020144 [Aristida adscensionis]